MLLFIREKSGSFFAKAILVAFIVVFGVLGLSDFTSFNNRQNDAIAKVGDMPISRGEFELVYRQYLQRFKNMFGNQFPVEVYRQDMINQAINSLITQKLFENMIADNGFAVEQNTVLKVIAENPNFRDESGQFNAAIFRATLARMNISETHYVELLQHDIIANYVRDVVLNGYDMPSFYLERLYNYEFEQRDIRVASLPLAAFQEDTPSEEELKSYFNDNKHRFQTPEYRTVQYIHLNPKELAKPIDVSDADIEAYYQQFKARYETPEQRHIKQLIATNLDAAQAAENALKEGVSFEDVPDYLGDNSVRFVDLGTIPRERILRDLAQAAFSADEGTITSPLQSSLGFHILKILAIEGAVITDIDTVRDEIRDTIKMEKAYAIMAEQMSKVEELIYSLVDLPSIAVETGMTLQTLPAIARNGQQKDGNVPSILTGQTSLLQRIFNQSLNSVDGLIDLDDGSVVAYQVTAIEAPAPKSFEIVRDEVMVRVQQNRADVSAREKATALVDAINSGVRFAEAVKDLPQVSLAHHSNLRRDGTTINGDEVVLNNFVLERAFALPLNKALYHVTDDTVIIALVEGINPPAGVDEEQKANLTRDMNAQLQQDLAEQFSDYLKQQYRVEIFADKLQNLFPEPVTVPSF